jgi:hypothetical protein
MIRANRFLFLLVCTAILFAALWACPVVAQTTQPQIVSPGLCRVKTDMEMERLYSLPVNFHSRTHLKSFNHIPGGITPATVRLQGGIGNVQLTPAWLDYVERINGHNPVVMKYLFHKDSGWQNSNQYGRVEQLVFENQWLEVLRVSGNRAYVKTFFLNQSQPGSSTTKDARIQLFTIVTDEDKIIGTPKGDAYIILMARPGESLYLGTQYLDCPGQLPGTVTIF